ncbi:ABC transporter ATP-binding protein [Clostridium algidicarnis]|uniref:ABC transporter ATP-binding protein n=1 Tax=Clostridium algidicarnis TaxID=37659 RepID=UPI001C0AC584|nr:ABC transporter ATP-binding protein [Clostridium algidicarnis]MBU3209654.1 ABC transporter ATP-binding protein [Clostridium algidicarnis]
MSKNIILKIENITISYNEHKVIDNINLSIEKGKIYSIIGPNGCGKTTLLRTMSRNTKPKCGNVFLEDKDMFKMKTKDVAKKMAVLCQRNDGFTEGTVRELVQYGRFSHKRWWKGKEDKDDKIVDWAINKTGLQDLQYRNLNTLSGGERQRAWIAMAIAQKPEVLLLDEPTTYLDISHQLEIMELISKLNKEEGITIIMVIHDINHAIRYSDEIIVIQDKKIFIKGGPLTILESGVLEKVFKVEAELIQDKEGNKPIFYAKRALRR